MAKSKLNAQAEEAFYFNKFKEGHEKGLEYFYRFWYPKLYYKGLKYIKDDVNADGIVNEAFLRLWLLRPSITAVEQIEQFIKKLTSDAYKAYYKTAGNKFQRNMLSLDALEDYGQFIGEIHTEDEQLETACCQAEADEVTQTQWAQVRAVLPNLKVPKSSMRWDWLNATSLKVRYVQSSSAF
ncbi:hypothetical protein [Pedobacter sp. Leaf170]|uniref:hypothetical protein n=1 Tax=Pedobacter sp. Leaf170 TaxID=2876558 RepID=UPI001E4D45C1|nr:hypothetical protein [Pedobacter sp. Leaf170]